MQNREISQEISGTVPIVAQTSTVAIPYSHNFSANSKSCTKDGETSRNSDRVTEVHAQALRSVTVQCRFFEHTTSCSTPLPHREAPSSAGLWNSPAIYSILLLKLRFSLPNRSGSRCPNEHFNPTAATARKRTASG